MNIKLNGKELKQLLKVKYAISKDETKPVLCGIHFYIKNNKLYSEAIDGYRAAKTSIDYQCNNEIEFIISEKDIKQINKHTKNNSMVSIKIDNKEDIKNQIDTLQNSIDDLSDEIMKTKDSRIALDLLNKKENMLNEIKELYISSNQTLDITIDDNMIHCNTIPFDEYINLDKLFYRKYQDDIKEFTLDKKELLSTLKELKKNMKRVINNLVELNFSNNQLVMVVTGKDENKITMSINCNMKEDFQIGFNIKYLIDLINSYTSKELTIKATTKINLIQIEEDDIKGILLPIRIVNN